MKAIRKSDGKVIEVDSTPYFSMKTDEEYRRCLSDGKHYKLSELDLSVNETKEAESTVLRGWVCRDDNSLNAQVLIGDKPKRTGYGFWENKSADCIVMPKDSFPDLTWDSEPIEVEIAIKPKKKL